MSLKFGVLGIIVLAAFICESTAVRCLSCNGIFAPQYCVKSKECAVGEYCYTEQVIDDDLNIFYNTGCKSKELCKVASEEGFGKRSGQLHVCEKCCNADKCNTEACTHSNATGVHMCYQCSDVARPGDCTTLVECRSGEMCFTQEFVNSQLQRRFSLGCEKITRCDLLNQLQPPHQRSTQLCNKCCEYAKCNQYLCVDTLNPGTTTRKPRTSTIPGMPLIPDLNKASSTSASQIQPCEDSNIINCNDLNATGTLCTAGSQAATAYCPKFCKLC